MNRVLKVPSTSPRMSISPLLSATVLGKRKAVRKSASLVLHLASSPEPSHPQSDSDFEPPTSPVNSSKFQPLPPIIINGQLVENTKRRYKCTHKGCTKAYTKPSRLEEHERSHTGEVNVTPSSVPCVHLSLFDTAAFCLHYLQQILSA